MAKRIITAIIVSALNFSLYAKANEMATAERGCSAIGGEEMLLVFGIFLAVYILAGGFEKKKSGKPSRAAANQTESEQSKSNRFDA